MKAYQMLAPLGLMTLVALQGCQQEHASTPPPTSSLELPYTISVGQEPAQEHPASAVFSGVEYIALETPENGLIGEVTDLDIHNDTIYLVDNKKRIFRFSTKGTFIDLVDKHGNGPGEYNLLEALHIRPSGTIELVEAWQSRTHLYSSDWKYIGSSPLPISFTEIEPIGQEGYAIFIGQVPFISLWGDTLLTDFVRWNPSAPDEFAYRRELAQIEFTPEVGFILIPFPSRFWSYNGTAGFAPLWSDSLFRFTSSGAEFLAKVDYGEFAPPANPPLDINKVYKEVKYGSPLAMHIDSLSETDAMLSFHCTFGEPRKSIRTYFSKANGHLLNVTRFADDLDHGGLFTPPQFFTDNLYAIVIGEEKHASLLNQEEFNGSSTLGKILAERDPSEQNPVLAIYTPRKDF